MMCITLSLDTSNTSSARDSSYLRKCFSAIVDRKEVLVEDEVVDRILRQELNLKFETLSKDLIDVLPHMLMVYIKGWPGWKRSKEYFSGTMKFMDWYNKFRHYIDFKINTLIQTEYVAALESMKRDERDMKNRGWQATQTDNLVNKENAPFELAISCPAANLNRITIKEEGNDVVVKLSPEIQWFKLKLGELLNWPYVSVEFVSPELHFTRRNRNEYNRYLGLPEDQYKVTTHKFDEIVLVNPSLERSSYSINFLKLYAKQYYEILQTMPNMINKAEETLVVVGEFLKDIEEIGINNSMATNTRVTFNIGRCFYVRTRRKAKNRVNEKFNGLEKPMIYTEILTPKMETTLIYFKGIQAGCTPSISFSYLNMLKESIRYQSTPSLLECAVPKITYGCILCCLTYDSMVGIEAHLETVHKSEPSYCCPVCMKPVSVKKLCGARWKHLCELKAPISKKKFCASDAQKQK